MSTSSRVPKQIGKKYYLKNEPIEKPLDLHSWKAFVAIPNCSYNFNNVGLP